MDSFFGRLATYVHWPFREGLYGTLLADNGFYYTGKGDELKCFMCGVVVGNWRSGDDSNERHRRASPNCLVVRDFSNRPTAATLGNQFSTSLFDSSRSSVSQDVSSEVASASAETELSTVHEVSVKMKSEAARLATFAAWPKTDLVAPKLLACEGFFYVGPGDRVKCAFCEGELENWEKGVNPVREHGRNFIYCPFVQGHDVGNKAINECDQQHNRSVQKVPSSDGLKVRKVSSACSGESRQTYEQGHLCAICYTENKGVVFEPYGHACTCVTCAMKITTCPLCQKFITKCFRIYFP